MSDVIEPLPPVRPPVPDVARPVDPERPELPTWVDLDPQALHDLGQNFQYQNTDLRAALEQIASVSADAAGAVTARDIASAALAGATTPTL